MLLEGKSMIVTGGNSGIGEAIVLAAAEGANLVVFLASDRAAYLTATTVVVDGGIMQGRVGL